MKTITRTLSVLLSVLFLTLAVISVFCFSTSAAEPSAVQPRAVMDNAYISQKIADFASKRYCHNSTYVDDPDHTGGYECFGFANEIAKYIFGSYPTYYMSAAYVYPGWTVKYGGSAVDNLRVGDIVRYWYHSIFITGIDGDIITYCQANVPSGTNRVTYGNTITRSELKSRVSQQLTSGTTKTGWVAHYDQNMWTPAHVHTPLKQPAVAPTCTTHGLTAGSICSECFYNIEPQEIIIALGHNHVASVTAPTCTKEGYTTHTCSRCGDSYSDSKVPAKGHTPGSAATCTSDQVCTTCGTVVKTKLGHSYTAKVTDPTCTKEGYTTHTCVRCGDSFVDTKIPAMGHNPVAIPAIHPTCTDLGKTEGSRCSTCGEILVRQTDVAPLGHTEMALPAKEATCTETGLTCGSRCEVCGVTLISQQEIPAKGHATVIDPAKTPTCTEAGLTEGKHCSACGEILVARAEVAPTGHVPDGWSVVAEPSVGVEGKRQQACSACGAVLNEETIPALPVETEPVTDLETDPVTAPVTDPATDPVTDPVTETPTVPAETVTEEEEETSADPDGLETITIPLDGCSSSVLSCCLPVLIVLAGAALIKRKE